MKKRIPLVIAAESFGTGKTATIIPNTKLEIILAGIKGNYQAQFRIGVQKFHVAERENKKEALWYCQQLKTAFKNAGIKTGKIIQSKTIY